MKELALFKRHSPKKKEKPSVFSIIIVIFLLLYTAALVALLWWGLMTAFKNNLKDYRLNKVGWPKEWTFDNFVKVYNEFAMPIHNGDDTVSFPMLFLYGFLYSLGCAFAASFVPCLTSYLCAKFDYKLSKIIYLIVVVTMILPIVGSLPAEIKMAKTLHIYNQIWGTWILKANFLGLYFIVFYNYFRSMPNAYIEAAKIDGAGNLRILFRVILPMARPLFLTVLLLNFITFWNDYQVPLVYLDDYPTVAVGMYKMAFSTVGGKVSNVPCRCAAASLMLLPILIIFLAFHKKLLGNLTMGGIKG
jgi:N-acetylglucosamine transport system permease protein